MQTVLLAVVFCLFYINVYCQEKTENVNCSVAIPGSMSCFTCLGRDSENCEWGQTCCKTACFKLIDQKHDIIAKGCWNEDSDYLKQLPEDDSARSYTTTVALPWSNNELLKGMAHYCTKGNFCNSATRPVAILSSFMALLLALLVINH